MLKKLIGIYLLSCKEHQEQMLDDIRDLYGKSKSINDDVLKKCVKGPHQRRMTQSTLNEAVTALMGMNGINKLSNGYFIDFEHLYDSVRYCIKDINGVGDLTIYDTALRLGAIAGLHPEQYVYLACGARKGAIALYGKKNFKFREPYSFFVPLLGCLNAQEIEDFLCIMKKYLIRNGVNQHLGMTLFTKLKSCSGNDMYRTCCSYLYKDKDMTVFKDDVCDNQNNVSN